MTDRLIRPSIAALRPYVPGKPIEEVERELGLTNLVKLASNENCLGPSPRAVEAVRAAAPAAWLYPDAACFALKRSLSEFHALPPDHFTLGTGSDEILHLISLAFFNPGDEVAFGDPSFVVYESAAALMGCVPVKVPLRAFTHDLAAMRTAITERTKCVFIANPNNPTGTMNTADEVERFLDGLPEHVIVVMDEAYHEYVERIDYPLTLRYVREGRNVVVLRTFSKIYALAGLRVGYGMARPELSKWLNAVREPFNVNSLAQVAAIASLHDAEQVTRTRAMNSAGKAWLYRKLERLGLPFVPTEANFLLIEVGRDSNAVFQALLRKGVIVRTGDLFGLPTYIRVTIGTEDMNRRFIHALELALGEVTEGTIA